MKVLHDLPKEVINTIKSLGIIVNELDEHGNLINYYNLPQWFKDVSGHIFECPVSELPESAKHIHLSYRDYKRVFTLQEMIDCWQAGSDKANGIVGEMEFNIQDDEPTKEEYFKQVLGVDISADGNP